MPLKRKDVVCQNGIIFLPTKALLRDVISLLPKSSEKPSGKSVASAVEAGITAYCGEWCPSSDASGIRNCALKNRRCTKEQIAAFVTNYTAGSIGLERKG